MRMARLFWVGLCVGVGAASAVYGNTAANEWVSVTTPKAYIVSKDDDFYAYHSKNLSEKSPYFTVTVIKTGYTLTAPTPQTGTSSGKMTLSHTGTRSGAWRVDPNGGTEEPHSGTVHLCDVSLSPREVSFSGGLAVTPDAGGAAYSGPHWKWGSPETKPAAYVRNTKPTVTVKFAVNTGNTKNVFATGVPVRVRARGPGLSSDPSNVLYIKDTAVSLEQESPGDDQSWVATLSKAFDQPLPNTIKCYGGPGHASFKLNWEMTINGWDEWVSAGMTTHDMYVTLGTPGTPLRQESLFYISCAAANNEKEADKFVDAVWSKFASLDVHRKGGNKQMTYWKPRGVGYSNSVGGMLGSENANGNCMAWAQLFHMPFPYGINSPTGLLLIKNWRFDTLNFVQQLTQMLPGLDFTPYTHIYNPGDLNMSEIIPETRIDAQGQPNTTSPEWFDVHYIVNYKDKYYDPSYGTRTLGLLTGNWELLSSGEKIVRLMVEQNEWERLMLKGFVGAKKYIDNRVTPPKQYDYTPGKIKNPFSGETRFTPY